MNFTVLRGHDLNYNSNKYGNDFKVIKNRERVKRIQVSLLVEMNLFLQKMKVIKINKLQLIHQKIVLKKNN